MWVHDGTATQRSYRGRSSAPLVNHPKRWAVAGLLAAVVFSTGATAVTKRQALQAQASVTQHSLPAGVGLRQFTEGFAVASW
jgi:hypothetical protein